jgi:hypothetical protein
MAYNVLKGAVEGSVDQHADQEIDGVKVFKNTVSAATFYDTDAQSPCATENNVALNRLSRETPRGILVYEGDKVARTNRDLTLDENNILRARHAVIGTLTGSGAGLTDLRATKLIGKVRAESIEYGRGLESYRDELKVKGAEGIKVDKEGVSVDLYPNSGLGYIHDKLTIKAKNALSITHQGQNASDDDLVLIHDTDRGEVRHSTLKNLYENYINFKIPHPQGPKYALQYKGQREFEGTPDLMFDPRSSTLDVEGSVNTLKLKVASHLESNGELRANGALYKGIKVVTDAQYDFKDTDNTVLFSPTKHKIVATLPPAKESAGRVITVKQICGSDDRYKISKAYGVTIRTEGEMIDFSREVAMKSNYSVRTFHCDGDNWWIINRSGS